MKLPGSARADADDLADCHERREIADGAGQRAEHAKRPYFKSDYTYEEDYRPAYEYGWKSRADYRGLAFEEVEPDLGRTWDRTRNRSRLNWESAKQATRDAWDRVERAMPGDADGDGR